MRLYVGGSVVVFVLLLLYLMVYSQPKYEEGFDDYDGYYPRYCRDCNSMGWRGEGSCMSCQNCGWCVDGNGYGSCVQGDANGPYFADCVQYYYGGGIGNFAPVGPRSSPWYQRYFIPWYGGYGIGGGGRDVYRGMFRRRWTPVGNRRFYRRF